MAIQYIKGNSPLGSLGTLGVALGTITGNPFLSALGTGMTAANSMINGQSNVDTYSTFQDALKGVFGGWKNPASGNIAKQNPDEITPEQYQDWVRKYGGIKY